MTRGSVKLDAVLFEFGGLFSIPCGLLNPAAANCDPLLQQCCFSLDVLHVSHPPLRCRPDQDLCGTRTNSDVGMALPSSVPCTSACPWGIRLVRYHGGTRGCSSMVSESPAERPCDDCCWERIWTNECCVPARSEAICAVSTSLTFMNIFTVTLPRMPSHRSCMSAENRERPVATDCSASRLMQPASRDSEKKRESLTSPVWPSVMACAYSSHARMKNGVGAFSGRRDRCASTAC